MKRLAAIAAFVVVLYVGLELSAPNASTQEVRLSLVAAVIAAILAYRRVG